jgi:hypothetical protein
MHDNFTSFKRSNTLSREIGEIEIKDLGGNDKHKK